MRTQGAFYADTPHGGGFVWYGASDVNWTTPASLVYTRVAGGNYALVTTTASTQYYITANLAELKRLQVYPEQALGATPASNLPYQEQFGTASGTAGYPAGAPGLPPFAGASQLTPLTTVPAKGIRLNSIGVIFLITSTAIAANTVTLYRTAYANNVAPSITNVALSTNTLAVATQANPYFTTVTVTTPVFETLASTTDLIIEIGVLTALTPNYSFYGIVLGVDFNFD